MDTASGRCPALCYLRPAQSNDPKTQEELHAVSWSGCWQTDAEAEREREAEDENGRFCDSKPPLLQEVWEKGEHTASLKAFQVFTLRSAGFLA